MTESPGSDIDTTKLAWEHVYSASPPELRRWLDSARPLALHQDALMLAVPNTFTRNQLEGRFRQAIEQELTGYFRRSMQLAVIVDEALTPGARVVPGPERQHGGTRSPTPARPAAGTPPATGGRVAGRSSDPVELLRGGAGTERRLDVTTSG